jgi:hypothetical protein
LGVSHDRRTLQNYKEMTNHNNAVDDGPRKQRVTNISQTQARDDRLDMKENVRPDSHDSDQDSLDCRAKDKKL